MTPIVKKILLLLFTSGLTCFGCAAQADQDVIKVTGAISPIPTGVLPAPAEGTEPYKSGVLEAADAATLIGKLCLDQTDPTTCSKKTTIINILRWKDPSHSSVSFQKWYLYDPTPPKTSFYLQSKQQIFQQTAIPGRTDLQFIYIHLNADLTVGVSEWAAYSPPNPKVPTSWPSQYSLSVNSIELDTTNKMATVVTDKPNGFVQAQQVCLEFTASCVAISTIQNASTFQIGAANAKDCTAKCGNVIAQNPPLKNPVSYSITVSKQQTQFIQDLQTLLQIVGIEAAAGGARGVPPSPGYFSITSFQSRWDTSSITIVASLNDSSKGTVASPGSIKSGTTSNQLSSSSYQNQKPTWIGLSAGIPITTYKDVIYQSSSGTLVPTSITQQKAYIFLDGYVPPVLPSLVSFRYIPQPFVGLPLKGEVFRHTMLGAGIGLHWLEPFGGVIFDTQNNKTVIGTITKTNLTYQVVFGLKISISALAKALKK